MFDNKRLPLKDVFLSALKEISDPDNRYMKYLTDFLTGKEKELSDPNMNFPYFLKKNKEMLDAFSSLTGYAAAEIINKILMMESDPQIDMTSFILQVYGEAKNATDYSLQKMIEMVFDPNIIALKIEGAKPEELLQVNCDGDTLVHLVVRVPKFKYLSEDERYSVKPYDKDARYFATANRKETTKDPYKSADKLVILKKIFGDGDWHGIDVNLKNNEKCTPLDMAMGYDSVTVKLDTIDATVVRFLLENGANPDKGMMPKKKIIALLQEKLRRYNPSFGVLFDTSDIEKCISIVEQKQTNTSLPTPK
ncbi:MAG: hypothetical protein KAT71_04925 [Gammaproteobacteria bacterium]|nr:hypothetical protein [Gammaproteobacteria bacterium]